MLIVLEEDVKEGSIPQIMIDYEMARKPQTGEDWTRNKSIDPIKISKVRIFTTVTLFISWVKSMIFTLVISQGTARRYETLSS